MAVHAPITGTPLRAPSMPLHRRRAIEDEIEMHLHRAMLLIARLDRADAPFAELEDDDPAGDPLDEHGEEPASCGRELLTTMPLYSIDQTRGPINEREAHREWHRMMMAG